MTSVDRVTASGVAWVATDGNAASSVSEFTSSVDALQDMIDWPRLDARYWHNTPED